MLLLPETLTLHEASDTLRMLEQAVQRDGGEPLAIDASAVKSFDSAALAVLLACHRLAVGWGRPFAVRGAPPAMRDLAALYGVSDLLSFEPAPAG